MSTGRQLTVSASMSAWEWSVVIERLLSSTDTCSIFCTMARDRRNSCMQSGSKDVLEQQSIKMGRSYDTPESKAHIKPFIDRFQLWDSMKEMVKSDPDAYENFNAFFSREIRPDARPVHDPENEMVTSSPADCRSTAFPTIDLATKYWIKGFGFTLERLFNDAELAEYFDGGSIVIGTTRAARLSPLALTDQWARSTMSRRFLARTTPSTHKPSTKQER